MLGFVLFEFLRFLQCFSSPDRLTRAPAGVGIVCPWVVIVLVRCGFRVWGPVGEVAAVDLKEVAPTASQFSSAVALSFSLVVARLAVCSFEFIAFEHLQRYRHEVAPCFHKAAAAAVHFPHLSRTRCVGQSLQIAAGLLNQLRPRVHVPS